MQPAGADFIFDQRDDAARHFWYQPECPRPALATTQWLSVRVRLHGFVAHSPASHFAIVLRARLGFDARRVPVSISGRGMTLGDTSLAQPAPGNPHAPTPGFGGARGAQLESFWPGGNFLYRDTGLLPQGLRDDCWYAISLRVDDARRIDLALDSDAGDAASVQVQDRIEHPVCTDATGVLLALGRGPLEHGPWNVEFRDIHWGWR